MKELISIEQANKLMYVVLIAAPIIGVAFGAWYKTAVRGLLIGLAIGVGNLIMWRIYNAITDHLGLDTVKNLFVNLALFVVVGIAIGVAWAKFAPAAEAGGGSGPALVGAGLTGGPADTGNGASRTADEAQEPPRDAG